MNEKGNITRDSVHIERILTGYHAQFYVNKFENLDEIGKLIENYS